MIVGVLPNLDKSGCGDVVEKLSVILKNEGIEAYIPNTVVAAGYKPASEDELFEISDVIITIGGDGTIIRYAKLAAKYNKPVLGINAGRIGYLANLEQNELSLISKLKSGDYFTERRMMLTVSVAENGKHLGEYTALNDAVITSGFISRIIDVSATVAGDSISYRADGLIISTPTGSTAYSMSAGGPIIDPLMQSMGITPICSHSLAAKPILMSAGATIKLKAFSKKRTEIYLTIDGRKVCAVKPNTEIYIKKSPEIVRLIRLNNRSFYKTLSYKFKDARSM